MPQAFRKIQFGKESTRGTGVAATKKAIGTLTVTPQMGWHRPIDERGSLANFRRQVEISRRASLRYEGDATYEQILDFMLMGVKGGVTGVQQGGVGAYKWTFTPNLTSANAQNAYTVEYGDDVQAWDTEFVQVSNLELSWSMDQPVNLSCEMYGQFPAKSTFTSLANDAVVNEVVGNNLSVSIDGAWGDLTATSKADLVLGGNIRFETGLTPVKYADGTTDFSSFQEAPRNLEVELEMVVNANMITEYDAYAAGTDRAIRLKFTGPNIVSSYNNELQLDFMGRYTSEPELFSDMNGDDVVRMTLQSHTDASGNEMRWIIQNNVAVV